MAIYERLPDSENRIRRKARNNRRQQRSINSLWGSMGLWLRKTLYIPFFLIWFCHFLPYMKTFWQLTGTLKRLIPLFFCRISVFFVFPILQKLLRAEHIHITCTFHCYLVDKCDWTTYCIYLHSSHLLKFWEFNYHSYSFSYSKAIF